MRTFSLLALLALLAPLVAHAQEYAIDEGSVLLGGTANFSRSSGDLYESSDDEVQYTLTLRPNLQYFVLPGLAVGGELQFDRKSHGNNATTTVAVGPAASYYFGSAESTLYPFASATLLYMNERLKTENFGSRSTPGLGLGFSGGLAFRLSPNVALTGEVFYLLERLREDEVVTSLPTDGNTLGLRIGVSTFIF